MNPEEYLESIGYVFEKDHEELYKEEYVEELKLKELLELLENYHQQKLSEITDDAIKEGIENPIAFPMYNELGEIAETGMTLRDYFAAKHMQTNADNEGLSTEDLVYESYKVADAMLRERMKKD